MPLLLANCSYRRKFKADLENVAQRVKRVLKELGRDENEISLDEIEAFCKHAGFLKVIRYRSLDEEYTSPRTKFIRIPTKLEVLIRKRGNSRMPFRRR